MTDYKIHILGVPQRKNEMHRQKDRNKINQNTNFVVFWETVMAQMIFPLLHHFTDCIEYFFYFKYCEIYRNIKSYYC